MTARRPAPAAVRALMTRAVVRHPAGMRHARMAAAWWVHHAPDPGLWPVAVLVVGASGRGRRTLPALAVAVAAAVVDPVARRWHDGIVAVSGGCAWCETEHVSHVSHGCGWCDDVPGLDPDASIPYDVVAPGTPGRWVCWCGTNAEGEVCPGCDVVAPGTPGRWVCWCGTNAEGEVCPGCGTTLDEVTDAAAEWLCAECTALNAAAYRHCDVCGAPAGGWAEVTS